MKRKPADEAHKWTLQIGETRFERLARDVVRFTVAERVAHAEGVLTQAELYSTRKGGYVLLVNDRFEIFKTKPPLLSRLRNNADDDWVRGILNGIGINPMDFIKEV